MALTDRLLSVMAEAEAAGAAQLAAVIQAGSLARLTQLRTGESSRYLFLAELTTALRSLWLVAIQRTTEEFTAEFSEGFPASTKALSDTLLESFISGLRPRTAQQILATTERQVQDMIRGGMASGESADSAYANLLEKLPEISGLRALLITRTEVHAATQFTSWQLARRSLVPLIKIWNTVPDARTRDFGTLGRISQFNHRAMNGKQAQLTDAFAVPVLGGGYEYLMFPGDPRGSAGNIINCRCIQTYERA